MSVEEERAMSDATAATAKTEAEGSVLVLPRFDYNVKEKGLGGCSGCSSFKPGDGGND